PPLTNPVMRFDRRPAIAGRRCRFERHPGRMAARHSMAKGMAVRRLKGGVRAILNALFGFAGE
ncbi:MAG: hypothetical protein R3D02_17245, partial [Hyphomicrobiales bacterium]